MCIALARSMATQKDMGLKRALGLAFGKRTQQEKTALVGAMEVVAGTGLKIEAMKVWDMVTFAFQTNLEVGEETRTAMAMETGVVTRVEVEALLF